MGPAPPRALRPFLVKYCCWMYQGHCGLTRYSLKTSLTASSDICKKCFSVRPSVILHEGPPSSECKVSTSYIKFMTRLATDSRQIAEFSSNFHGTLCSRYTVIDSLLVFAKFSLNAPGSVKFRLLLKLHKKLLLSNIQSLSYQERTILPKNMIDK